LRDAAVTGVDQVTEVDIATGDHATERSVNAFEGFQFLEAPDIGLRRSDRGAPGGVVTDSVVYFLFGYAISFDQFSKRVAVMRERFSLACMVPRSARA